VRSESDVREAFRRLQAAGTLDGVYVQKMHPRGAELLVSAFRDPVFGVMVSCASGGVLTEIVDDVVTERAPVSRELAADMVGPLRIRRHAQWPATDAPARFVARFSELALTAPWARFVFEVNPLLWHRDSAVAVDGLLVIG